LVRTYRETVMVSLRFDRIEEFIEDAHYAQHASRIGDGIARLRDRIASVAKEGGQLYLTPRRFVAEGNFVLVLSEGDLPFRTYCALRSISGRERKNRRALGCLNAYTSEGAMEKLKWTILGSEVDVNCGQSRENGCRVSHQRPSGLVPTPHTKLRSHGHSRCYRKARS
jgi:hypothetical protein